MSPWPAYILELHSHQIQESGTSILALQRTQESRPPWALSSLTPRTPDPEATLSPTLRNLNLQAPSSPPHPPKSQSLVPLPYPGYQTVLIQSWRKSPWRTFPLLHLLIKSLQGLDAGVGQPTNHLVILGTLGEIRSPGLCGKSFPLFCNSFIEIYFTYHTIHSFKVYNSMVFSIFTEMSNHHHSQF